MAVSELQIKELLGQGLANEIVANATGCSASYISQLLAREDFLAEVIELRTANLTANTKRDRSIDALEDKVLAKLAGVVDHIYKPLELVNVAFRLNSMKRRGVSSQEAAVVNNTIVNLSMPTQIVQQFTKNINGEVIEVSGETMITMPAQQLLKKVIEDKVTAGDADVNRYQKAINHLPGTGNKDLAAESSKYARETGTHSKGIPAVARQLNQDGSYSQGSGRTASFEGT